MRLALALTSAALIATAARPWAHGAVAWVAFVPLLLALAGTRRWPMGALLGAVAGLGPGVVAFEGVAPAAPWAYPALVAVASLGGAAAGALAVAVGARRGLGAAWAAFALAWIAAEFLGSRRALWGDFADAITPIATTQFDTPLRWLAAWSSVGAVGLAVIAINLGAALLLRGRRWAGALLVAAPLATAYLPVPGTATPAAGVAPLRVAIVQGAVPSVDTLFARFDRDAAARMLEPYAALTTVAAQRGAELVVLGETVIPQAVLPGEPPSLVANALAAAPVALVGGVSFVAGRAHNAVFHAQNGALTEVYRKRARVPLNESGYAPGVALPPLDVRGVAVGLGICLDGLFPEFTRGSVRSGAQVLVVITEDGFAGRTVTPELHLRATAFRAIETGRWLVFANQSGPSAFIDQRGRLVERLEWGEEAGIVWDVPALAGVTPYVRLGDWVGVLAVVATVGLVSRASRRASMPTDASRAAER